MSYNNIHPLEDRVVIEPIKDDEKTKGGIIIPDAAKDKPMKGKVLAVGKGIRSNDGSLIPLDIKEGDIVLYGKWGGSEFKFEEKKLVIMKSSDVLAIIK